MYGKQRMKDYPIGVKLEAVRLFYEEGKTHSEIAQVLGLHGDKTVVKWVKLYRQEGELAFMHPRGRPRKTPNESSRIKQLEMENALLKKYHTELRKSLLAKRNIGLSTTTGRNTK